MHFRELQSDATDGATNENLAWGSVGYPASDLVQSWINEKSRYDGNPVPPGGGPAGHETAIVWHSTGEVGCGTSRGAQIEILYVATTRRATL